ncbi:MAG: LytTR family transcriptional regulator [Oricola sp.]|jgi:hypothetical protein|nr:LytTR family transcriptional regulator [Oricola sp.]
MTDTALRSSRSDPRREDARADRQTFVWVACFMAANFLVDILSAATEIGRSQSGYPVVKIVIYEATGYAVFLAMFPIIARLASIATPGQQDWRIVVPFHLAASLGVSIIHVTLMVLIRKVIFLAAFAEPYIFTDNLSRDFIYEYRKDLFGYALFIFLIMFGRLLEQQRRELAAAREEARKSSRLTLKCGGRTVFVDAADVIWVKSASNYVEVMAGGVPQLARATLASVERQLADAGAPAVRVHRSWIVNPDHIARIEPTGEGDVRIEMTDGTLVPGSRRYREKLAGTP